MSRPVALALSALSLFLLALTLVPAKPGLPTNLKADEPAYYLMAWSLAADRDLRCEVRDVDRLFREFPLSATRNLVLMSDDGWHSAYFGKPFIYPLFAAPFVALFGGNGMLFANMLLTLAMIWLGTLALADRGEEDWAAALFAVGFFLLSASFVYVFWLQPEVFNMAAVAGSLYLGLSRRPRLERATGAAIGSGALLALAGYNKPVFLALCLPVLWRLWRERGVRGPLHWGAGCAVALLALAGGSVALTGHPTAYLGVTRMGVEIEQPGLLPFAPAEPAPVAVAATPPAVGAVTPAGAPLAAGAVTPAAATPPAAPAATAPPANSWWWIFRFPDVRWGELREDLTYFLVGRHTGLVWYHPFAVLAVVTFLLWDRRAAVGWMLLGGLGVVAAFFVLWIPWNYQGGGGFVGNRYFVSVYPAFLFLVPAVRPRALLPAGFAIGGLLVGPLLLTPFGWPVAWSTLQAHVRNFPYPHFPLELSLRNVPGYEVVRLGGLKLSGRRDVFLPRGESFWVGGAERVELWIASAEPLESAALRVRSLAAGNRVAVSLAGAEQVLEFGDVSPAGEEREVRFAALAPSWVSRRRDGPVHYYRLLVTPERGEIRTFTLEAPPRRSTYFAYNASWEENFYVGAVVTYLGPVELLDRPVYGVRWGPVEPPATVRRAATFTLPVTVANTSAATWPQGRGAAAVKLAYHWRRADGSMAVLDGLRSELPGEVAPGETVAVEQRVRAPDEPGSYLLELDLLFEHVSWFADRTGGQTLRLPVDVVP